MNGIARLEELLGETGFDAENSSRFIDRLKEKPELIERAIYFVDQGEEVRYDTLGELYNIVCLECPDKITGFLGKGVSGKVFSAYNQPMGIERALKVISADRVNEKEAQILASLRKESPVNFPKIYDAGVRDDIRYEGERAYFILMEKVDGETLNRKFEEEETLDYTCQIFDGIRYLRSKGVTHRDLHPKNIIITLEGIIKILDFGIVSDEETPEPKDNRRYGGATDFFSLGLIAYKMFTGDHFILSKSDEMTTNSYANIIARLKRDILEEGILKGNF